MNLKFWVVALIIFFPLLPIAAQNCVPTQLNGAVRNLACNQVCTTLTFQIPHIKETGNYVVNSITYNPLPFVTTAPALTHPCSSPSSQDDKFFDTTFLPFPFCFFGDTYSRLAVSSNALISFDATNALKGSNWSLDAVSTLPFGGTGIMGTGVCPVPSGTLLPRASILAGYSDINISNPSTNKKIEARLEGIAPCRKMVVSYNEIPMHSTTCDALLFSSQIILYESTGLIDIFIRNKPSCPGWNNGLGILGIQNWDRNMAVAAPGKNNTVWSETNTGYRFTPASGGSRFLSAQLFTLSGSLVATADTSTVVAGLLDLNFANVCTAPGSNQYRIVTRFSACDNPATILTTSDTITVNRPNLLNATATTTNSNCGVPTGSITVSVPAGAGSAPYSFVLDGTITLSGNSPMLFNNVASGPHVVTVTDASGGCTGTVNVTVGQTNNLTATLTPTATSCPLVNNGTISVVPANGLAPYTVTLNPGNIILTGTSILFSGLAPGSYSISVTDAAGCISQSPLTASVATGPSLTGSASVVPTSCAGGFNGSATITSSGGTGPFSFLLDGTIGQTGNVANYAGLAAGSHSVVITDAVGCASNTILFNIPEGPVLNTSAIHTDVLCNGSATGSITVNQPSIGSPPFEYSVNGTSWQSSNVFTGLAAGTYTVYYRESSGCQGQLTQTISEPATLSISVSVTDACNGQNNGSIGIVAMGGITPYEYSINGGISWQSSNTFTVASGTYDIVTRDARQCTRSQTVNVIELAAVTASVVSSNATCNGGANGSITISANGGSNNFRYSIDGTIFQTSNKFNVLPGNYTVSVKDGLGCTVTVSNIMIGIDNDLSITPPGSPTICEGASVQLLINSNAQEFSWTPSSGLSSTSVNNPIASPDTTTTYMVTLGYGLCSLDIPLTVNVNPAPVPDAGPDGLICFGQDFQLQASGGIEFSWSPGTYLDNPGIPNPVASPEKSIIYSLMVRDALGCQSLVADKMVLEVTPPLKVYTFPGDTVVMEGEQFEVRAVSSGSVYNWTPSSGLSDPTIPNPIVTAGAVGDEILYKVTAVSSAGCKGEGIVRVRVFKGPEIYTPTGFTPNGDGRNDLFYPFPVGIKKINYFRVFNRWGQMLFSTATLNKGWDGKFGGTEQPGGVYVWILEATTLDNRIIRNKGTVTLIR